MSSAYPLLQGSINCWAGCERAEIGRQSPVVRMPIIKKTSKNKSWQGKRNSYSLLVGMQISSVIMKISVEGIQEIKNRILP
jgi:hypothetical protein